MPENDSLIWMFAGFLLNIITYLDIIDYWSDKTDYVTLGCGKLWWTDVEITTRG